MRQGARRRHTDGLTALLLFGVFAACVLAVLLTGAGAYRRLVRRDQAAYERRTCVQYIATRVRQADCQGGIRVDDFKGVPSLVMDQGDGYNTQVYCYDGWLMELYAASDAGLSPEDGDQIMEINSLELSLEEGLLTVKIGVPDGTTDTLLLSPRGGEGADA